MSPSVNTGSLIGSIALATPVITPNGDAVNDQLKLSYEILAVVGTARIRVEVVDLGGRSARTLFDGLGQNGVYAAKRLPALAWDGRDERNELVPPGLYLVRIEVEGDARASATVRSVGVS